ncbi:exodeoxyribonuclease V subunit alpha [Celerinatantimonas diazotrophica]|uniref:RecBCD enzyme subunit RecD n=1 Tax=Celerinatantimonas diazotrophica TaxID=412034 RepID=A0A4R1K0Y4_9GAMM|nr:exodeoxyribonuclease V subunit alpha [Celerinatantimonas diazotrophica]TCK57614.1 DNA helicase/exodeoxyribonuclease V alpha subunit [Celerinatantimonas diazotrophica]CAG9298324.1 RecBCD enzyme subunit RecD [Celerinatantimonas diazotrophica]
MSDWQQLLTRLREEAQLRSLDWHFARFMQSLGAEPEVALAAALTSKALSRGDSCLPLEMLCSELESYGVHTQQPEWVRWLNDSALVGEDQPLVFDLQRLYLNRYWQYECQLAQRLAVAPMSKGFAPAKVKPILTRLFGPMAAQTDWQRVAAAQACQRQLLVISGGPGTGKTTTVTRLLALVQELALKAQGRPLEVALVAPTGKAAARLSESIAEARLKLTSSAAEVIAAIPSQTSTIHRLLGVIPGRSQFVHHAQNPLLVDLLVVDEASMIDLSLMTHLFDALSPETKVILLGDRDQLASVEAGSVLADICEFIDVGQSHSLVEYLNRCGGATLDASSQTLPVVADNLVMLRKSYRFNDRSGIGQLSHSVNRGDSERAMRYLNDPHFSDIDWRPLSEQSYRYLLERCVQANSAYLKMLHDEQPLKNVFQAFHQFQLLVALRQGDFGVEGLNQRIQRQLFLQQLLEQASGWCPGIPVMVQANDHVQQLYNGDIGIFAKNSDGTLMVAFESAEQEGGIRWILPARLPEHEIAFAMTVHKSQGSEFAEVLMLLPARGSANPTRELLYTGITRARNHFSLIADEQSLKRACAHRTRRRSGLTQRLAAITEA